jgi:hypothetical protein
MKRLILIPMLAALWALPLFAASDPAFAPANQGAMYPAKTGGDCPDGPGQNKADVKPEPEKIPKRPDMECDGSELAKYSSYAECRRCRILGEGCK